ncbi:MAG: N-(5'-phosphoribosyl)anthranilate isomerase [Lachnoclostridium sp.]
MTKIKICGIKRPEDIHYVNKYRPDYIGFIFAQSSRRIDEDTAFRLKSKLSHEIQTVGVFVNESVRHIVSLCEKKIIDLVQLHGEEDKDYILRLKSLVPNAVIKAVRVSKKGQIEAARDLPCDYLLFDTYVAGQYGGSGKTFDRKLIPDISRPFFLAGGLKKENIAEAIADCHPYCVDISSGVETNGIKDEIKIKEIIEVVRALDS